MLQLKNIKKSYTTGEFTQVALDSISVNFRESELVFHLRFGEDLFRQSWHRK